MLKLLRIRSLLQKRSVNEGILVLFDQGMLSIATFITGILVAKSSSKEEFGLYVLCWSLLNVLLGFVDALISRPFAINLPHFSAGEKPSYQGSALVHVTLLAALGAVIIIYGSWDVASVQTATGSSATTFSLIVILLFFPYTIRYFLRNAALANLHVRAGVYPSVAGTVLQLLLIVAMYQLGQLTVGHAYLAIGASSLLSAAMFAAQQKGGLRIKPGRIIPDFRTNWKIARWLVVNATTFSAVSQSYPWIILSMLGTSSVAVFGACQAIATVAAPLLRGMNAYLLPRMSHGFQSGGTDRLFHLLRISTMLMSLPFALWMIVGTVFADPLLNALYSEEYTGHTALVFFLLLKNLIESSSAPVTNALQTSGHTKYTSLSLVIGAAIAVTLTPILINEFDVTGAGMAAATAAAIIAIVKWIYMIRLHKVPTTS